MDRAKSVTVIPVSHDHGFWATWLPHLICIAGWVAIVVVAAYFSDDIREAAVWLTSKW